MSRPAPKNVAWITTDHMRYDCIGAHGNAAMHTPATGADADRAIEWARYRKHVSLRIRARKGRPHGDFST